VIITTCTQPSKRESVMRPMISCSLRRATVISQLDISSSLFADLDSSLESPYWQGSVLQVVWNLGSRNFWGCSPTRHPRCFPTLSALEPTFFILILHTCLQWQCERLWALCLPAPSRLAIDRISLSSQ
jgi:hypothetical protein